MDCIFCKIVQKQLDAQIIFEDADIIAFKDIHPLAPVHILLIPKEHIASINDANAGHQMLLGKMILTAADLAKQLNIARGGYKLLFRTGTHGGQEVSHIHLHLIGGAPLFEDIHPLLTY